MLSYQHIYHAGGWFDVHKHAVLCALWGRMAEEAGPAPLTFIDTHAGRGLYDLTTKEAKKVAEFETGITRLDLGRLPKPFAPYVHAVRAWKPDYPGSAGCIAALKRDEDAMILHELHPGEIEHLKTALGTMPHLTIKKEDGHKATPDALPKGDGAQTLVMIDPSYEVKDEYEQTAETIKAILTRAPQTKILLWYPILAGSGYYKILFKALGPLLDEALSLRIRAPFAEKPTKGMVESGLILFNPPTGMEKDTSTITELLFRILKKG